MKIPARSLLAYIAVSFGFSWAVALGIHLAGGFTVFGNWIVLLLFAYMCGPAIGALVCVWLYEPGRRLSALGLSQPNWREMPWAWIGAMLLLGGALLISLAAPGYELTSPIEGMASQIETAEGLSEADRNMARVQLQMPGIAFILAGMSLIVGPAINAVLTLSEELGWRGYLWDQLKDRGFWSATWITGALWGVWHMPIIWMGHNYPETPLLGSVVFIILCLLMSPLYSWIRVKTNSVWGPGLLHGTTNGAAAYFILWQDPADMPWTGLVGIGGFIAAALATAAIWIVWRRQRPAL